PPLDELVTDPRARFDPSDPAGMAATMARCLDAESQALQASLRADATGVVDSWDTVARRTVSVWEQLASARRRPWRRRRRVAVVSPFPPVLSGVAGYSAAMVEAMRRVDERRGGAPPLEVDCFADGLDRYRVDPLPVGDARPRDAALFERFDGVAGGYEHVLYVLGNSECHAHALGALRRRPGTVLAHEVRLSGLLGFSARSRGAVPGGLEAAIERNYPGLPAGLGRGDRLEDADAERYGLYLLKDVVRDAERCAVFSESARRLACLDVGPGLDGRVGVVPFALWCLDEAQRRAVGSARAERVAAPGGDGGPAIVSSFGIVHPQKRPEALVLALAELRRRGHDVVARFVGPVSESMRDALGGQAAAAGVGDHVMLTGAVDAHEYLAQLGRTDVAVQLRKHFFGECSLTVGECLSAGVATVVSSAGWMGELPGDAVVKVDLEGGSGALADAIEPLLTTSERRLALGESGRAWASTQTFDLVAEAVLDLLGV
ncbi:MAG: glycosyltransferase, partial [Acidimicrobiales bacterium]